MQDSKVGLGVVIQQPSCGIILSTGMITNECLDVEMDELQALWYGLCLAVDHGLQNIILGSDSLTVVSRLQAQLFRQSVSNLIYEDIGQLIS